MHNILAAMPVQFSGRHGKVSVCVPQNIKNIKQAAHARRWREQWWEIQRSN